MNIQEWIRYSYSCLSEKKSVSNIQRKNPGKTISHNLSCKLIAISIPAGWDVPIIVKRLDARYDWLTGRWDKTRYELKDAGDGCEPWPSLGGAVAWLSEGNCSFFTKVIQVMIAGSQYVWLWDKQNNTRGSDVLYTLGWLFYFTLKILQKILINTDKCSIWSPRMLEVVAVVQSNFFFF